MEDAYTRDPCLKKLKPTDPDTGAVNNKLIIPCQRFSKGKTPIKKSDWVKIASAKASAKAQVKIAQIKMQHDLEPAKLHLQNERQMAKDKIKADQQSAWYKSIQPAGINSANRAVPMGGASRRWGSGAEATGVDEAGKTTGRCAPGDSNPWDASSGQTHFG
ncbi:hypothetical protein BDK51DRAFT_28429 [Blyttiomyces helicus]|uniref:Uncharacterized protein n=1 Tax=Blyttiomyces helicus TaxID=388810 RepID=A0A4V1IRH0_9FUNG|nr:hypothetical protein BDK51DRAFT_28429 [Blyttiomyces helicus]|eukprot:RKO90027.1 hypothetical protein BDK51DRAFT_28429 [Blyttiomyces helicus]